MSIDQQSSPALVGAVDEQQSDVMLGNESQDEHGVDNIAAEALVDADSRAAESHALDAASAVFGLQTNQQINFNGVVGPETPYLTTPLPSDTLARVRGMFVVPDDYPALRDRVLDANLVILSGRPGSGRQHLATHILDALCDGRVDHLTGGALADLDVGALEEDAGYLWTDITEGTSGAAEATHAERLIGALRERHAHMIIVSSDGAAWPFEVADHVHTLEPSLNLPAVLELHLRPDGTDWEAATAALLADPEVLQVRTMLSGAGEAARLGRALRDVLLGSCSVRDALHKAQGTADWFARLPEREDRAFALALATLDGLSYPTVVAGARQLDLLIQRAEDPKNRSCIRTLIRPTRQLLAVVDAVKTPGHSTTFYGEVPIVAVSSNRKKFPTEMLRTLWHDFPYLHEIYLDWLGNLVESTDPYVRDRAAVVVGLLATEDFDFVRSRVLLPWAGSDKRDIRRAAGIALRAPAFSGELRGIVWKLLDNWAAADGPAHSAQRFRRMTAAVALGGPVGATDCGQALEIIRRRLLNWEPNRYTYPLWRVTMTAVGDLFGDGGSAQSTAVLERLVEWAAEDGVGPRTVAVSGLLGIVGRPPVQGYRDDRRLAPVLRAAAADPANVRRITDLWRLGLTDRVLARTSITALHRLADNVDDSEGEDILLDLVRALTETHREARTLRYEIRQWVADDPHPQILHRLADLLQQT